MTFYPLRGLEKAGRLFQHPITGQFLHTREQHMIRGCQRPMVILPQLIGDGLSQLEKQGALGLDKFEIRMQGRCKWHGCQLIFCTGMCTSLF